MSDAAPRVLIRDLGFKPLPDVWADMQTFTSERVGETPDEIWFVEHPPVYTLGMRGDRKHVLASGGIPVVQIDRGGQVTYHGPGQAGRLRLARSAPPWVSTRARSFRRWRAR